MAPLAKQLMKDVCSFYYFLPHAATALNQSPPSAKHETTGEQRRTAEELRKGCAVAVMMLTFNSSLAAYLLRDDAEFVASVGATYLVIVLLLVKRFGGCRDLRTNGGGCWRCLDVFISFLSLSVVVLLASRVARTAAPSASPALLVAAAGAAALGVGGCCAYLLHWRSWSDKQQQQQQIILPLVQEWRG